MKKTAILIIFAILAVLAAPAVLAEYCDDFNEAECLANSARWFEADSCRSKIVCSPVYESYDEFGIGTNYTKCMTKYRNDFSDCINDPSAFCYNGMAYDVTKSRPCECGNGYQYMRLDKCGNPTEWSEECINIQTCDTRQTSSNIITHMNCEVTSCESNNLMLENGHSTEEFARQIEILLSGNIDNDGNLHNEDIFSNPKTKDEDVNKNLAKDPSRQNAVNGIADEKDNPEEIGQSSIKPESVVYQPNGAEDHQLERDLAEISTMAAINSKNEGKKEISTSFSLLMVFVVVYALYTLTSSSIRRHKNKK